MLFCVGQSPELKRLDWWKHVGGWITALQRRLGAVEWGIPVGHDQGIAILEVFPSPAQVVLFRLEKALPYKKKRGRTWAQCRQALADYLRHLRALSEPALRLPDHLMVNDQRGRGFKDLEDRIDAVMCAYVAAFVALGGNRVEMVGTLTEGYVILPMVRA